jgi:C4-dicarboxylate-specific signal transduction histidine kinase
MRQNKFSAAKAGAALGLALGLLAAPAAAAEARIGALVQEALRAASPASVAVDVSGGGSGLMVAAEPAAALKALKNVVAYSARAMAHRPARRLSVKISRSAAGVDVEFRDSGPGVAAEDLLAIYGYAATGAPAGDPRELLAETNRIALASGGRLLIDSAEGVGTDFTVELPVRKVDGDAIADR